MIIHWLSVGQVFDKCLDSLFTLHLTTIDKVSVECLVNIDILINIILYDNIDVYLFMLIIYNRKNDRLNKDRRFVTISSSCLFEV